MCQELKFDFEKLCVQRLVFVVDSLIEQLYESCSNELWDDLNMLMDYLEYFFIPKEDGVFFSWRVGHTFPNLPLNYHALIA